MFDVPSEPNSTKKHIMSMNPTAQQYLMQMANIQNKPQIIEQLITTEMTPIGIFELQREQNSNIKKIAKYLKVNENLKIKQEIIQEIMKLFIAKLITAENPFENQNYLTFKTTLSLLQKFPTFLTIVQKYNEQQQRKYYLMQHPQQFMQSPDQLFLFMSQQAQGQFDYLQGQFPQYNYPGAVPPQQMLQNPQQPFFPQQFFPQQFPQAVQPQQMIGGLNSIVNSECICAQNQQLQKLLKNHNTQSTITCISCAKLFHKYCLKISDKISKEEKRSFECPKCILRKNDPLHEVCFTLIQPFIVNSSACYQFYLDHQSYQKIQQNTQFGLEIRCLRIDDLKCHEQTWPDYGELILNDKKQLDFKPLLQNSALKKRKDEKFFTRDQIKPGQNTIRIKENKLTIDEKTNYRVNEHVTHIAGVYLIRKLSPQELIDKIKKSYTQSSEKCKNKIQKNFASQQPTDGQLMIDKVQVNLVDAIDMQLIKIPARGKYCQHVQCFSLENMVNISQNTIPRRWKCPICKQKCYELVIDSYLNEILETIKKQPNSDQYQEVVFYPNGNYEFKMMEIEKNDNDSDTEIKVDLGQPEGGENNSISGDQQNQQDVNLSLIQIQKSVNQQLNPTNSSNNAQIDKQCIILDSDEEKQNNNVNVVEEKNTENQQNTNQMEIEKPISANKANNNNDESLSSSVEKNQQNMMQDQIKKQQQNFLLQMQQQQMTAQTAGQSKNLMDIEMNMMQNPLNDLHFQQQQALLYPFGNPQFQNQQLFQAAAMGKQGQIPPNPFFFNQMGQAAGGMPGFPPVLGMPSNPLQQPQPQQQQSANNNAGSTQNASHSVSNDSVTNNQQQEQIESGAQKNEKDAVIAGLSKDNVANVTSLPQSNQHQKIDKSSNEVQQQNNSASNNNNNNQSRGGGSNSMMQDDIFSENSGYQQITDIIKEYRILLKKESEKSFNDSNVFHELLGFKQFKELQEKEKNKQNNQQQQTEKTEIKEQQSDAIAINNEQQQQKQPDNDEKSNLENLQSTELIDEYRQEIENLKANKEKEINDSNTTENQQEKQNVKDVSKDTIEQEKIDNNEEQKQEIKEEMEIEEKKEDKSKTTNEIQVNKDDQEDTATKIIKPIYKNSKHNFLKIARKHFPDNKKRNMQQIQSQQLQNQQFRQQQQIQQQYMMLNNQQNSAGGQNPQHDAYKMQPNYATMKQVQYRTEDVGVSKKQSSIAAANSATIANTAASVQNNNNADEGAQTLTAHTKAIPQNVDQVRMQQIMTGAPTNMAAYNQINGNLKYQQQQQSQQQQQQSSQQGKDNEKFKDQGKSMDDAICLE